MVEDRRERAAEYVASLIRSPRVRAATIDALLALEAVGSGTFVLNVPRQAGRPVDGSLVTGGLQLRLFEEREVAVA